MLLSVRIISPKEEVLSSVAVSVSSTNSAGDFDILPEHAKFVTLVEKKPIIVRPPASTRGEPSGEASSKEQKFEFDMAIIHVHANQVDIFINPSDSGIK